MKLLRIAALPLLAAGLLGCPKPSKTSRGPSATPRTNPGDEPPSSGDDSGDPADGDSTSSDLPGLGFNGLFEGDGLSLHLAQAGSTLRGTMEFRGDSFPVSARIEGPGRLVGTFASKGREFPLSATRAGEKVVLKSSNKTYNLTRVVPVDPLARWVESGESAELPSFRGGYLGTVAGQPASLKLLDAGADLAGELSCAGHRYTLEGSQGLRSATGSLQDVLREGKRMTFELTLPKPGTLDLTVTVSGEDGVQKHLMAEFQQVDEKN